jgi:anti-sigma-K factor RskA
VNEYTCSTVDELLAGYAADAIEEDERWSMAEHLAECRDHDAELIALRADLDRLATMTRPVAPPLSLRSDLLAAFDREAAGAQAVPAATVPSASRPAHPEAGRPEMRPSRRGFFAFPSFGYALASALLVLAVGLGVWGSSRGSGSDVVVSAVAQDGGSLEVTYLKAEHLAVLDLELESLPEGRIYQAWQIIDGTPVSLGVVPSPSGRLALRADLSDASAIALTVEPEGGSAVPTTNPILQAEI